MKTYIRLNPDAGHPCDIGFTGTREGMTPAQMAQAEETLRMVHCPGAALHLGDCVGGDAQAHAMGKQLGYRLIGHPPHDPKMRAFLAYDVEWETKPYFERDADIVRESMVLVAAPRTMREMARGGTWYTVRVARTLKRARVIVWPDGSVTTDKSPNFSAP